MSKVTMPEPVTYAHFTEDGMIRMWSRNPDHLQAVTEAIGKQPTALITTTQAEAYADARVREALEEAYQTARDVEASLLEDRMLHVSGPAAANYVANRIRKLTPPTE